VRQEIPSPPLLCSAHLSPPARLGPPTPELIPCPGPGISEEALAHTSGWALALVSVSAVPGQLSDVNDPEPGQDRGLEDRRPTGG
jgi:hypothetical protein